MKCNKCCNKITENEEIRDDKKFYCEVCWKNDSWKKTFAIVSSMIIIILFVMILLGAVVWIWKQIFTECD